MAVPGLHLELADASRFREKGKAFGNVPNVWAELGSVWRDAMGSPDQSAHLLGKLIEYPENFVGICVLLDFPKKDVSDHSCALPLVNYFEGGMLSQDAASAADDADYAD